MPQSRAKHQACPCCRTQDADHVFDHRFKLLLDRGESIVYKAAYWTCRLCEHTWCEAQDAVIDDALLFRYYSGKSNLKTALVKGDRQHRSIGTLAALTIALLDNSLSKSTRRPGGGALRILEIGGGDGAFAEVFLDALGRADTDYCIQDFGVFSDGDAPRFRRVTHLSEIEGKNFDVVVSRHTLEHVLSPAAFVRNIELHLKPGGCCYIEVPCWSLPHFSVDELNAEHFQHFTHQSIDVLVAQNTRLTPAGDFSVYLKDYYTPHRILGKLYQLGASAPVDRDTRLNQAESFRRRNDEGRARLTSLARRMESLLSAGKVVGVHGASITFEDFMLNEGAGLSRHANLLLFDGSKEKHGRSVGGLLVQQPSASFASRADVIISFSSYVPEIAAAWTELGFEGTVASYLTY